MPVLPGLRAATCAACQTTIRSAQDALPHASLRTNAPMISCGATSAAVPPLQSNATDWQKRTACKLPVVIEISDGRPSEATRVYQPQTPAALIASLYDEHGVALHTMAVPNTVDKRFHVNSCSRFVSSAAGCVSEVSFGCVCAVRLNAADRCYGQSATKPSHLVQSLGQAALFSFDLTKHASRPDGANVRWRLEVVAIDKDRTIIYRCVRG
jgi:hypothetical protein